MNQMLADSIVKALLILETHPLNKDFDEETLDFLQDLYLWRRPENFLKNDGPHKFISGCVTLWGPQQRCLQFIFDDGYIWQASIKKLGSEGLWNHCKRVVSKHFADEEAAFMEDMMVA